MGLEDGVGSSETAGFQWILGLKAMREAANFGRYSSHWHVLSPHRTNYVADIVSTPREPSEIDVSTSNMGVLRGFPARNQRFLAIFGHF